jgi:hypothetical protein
LVTHKHSFSVPRAVIIPDDRRSKAARCWCWLANLRPRLLGFSRIDDQYSLSKKNRLLRPDVGALCDGPAHLVMSWEHSSHGFASPL